MKNQVKLLLHVVEGTILLSNIFRSHGISSSKQIGIRNLNKVSDTEVDLSNSVQSVAEERELMVKIAQRTIDEEKRSLEDMRKVTTEDIAAMKNAWEDEKVQLQQQAYEEGFQIGFGEGRDKALSDMSDSLRLANEITEKSKVTAMRYQESQERVILELAMTAASRILGTEIEDHEERFLSIVERALKEVREMDDIKIYVSSEYYKLVSDHREELASIFPPDVPFLIFANEDFNSTECYIETNHGRVVVTVDDQLNELREQLIEILESGD